ncbi:hypothetical protein EPUL_000172, partial [Erysiphe pulchra]
MMNRIRPTFLAGIAAILLLITNEAGAFWRMGCRGRTGLVRIDPLVSPGTISEHIHAIHGSSGFSEKATYQDLMNGECTSCEVSEDKSAYWHPALYFQDATTEKFSLVPQVGGMLAYYLLHPNPGNKTLSSFPAGFQMIAGDTNQRNFSYPVPDIEKSLWNQHPYNTQAFLRQAALGFNCLNYNAAPEGALYRHFLPDKNFLDANCPHGVRFELMFPSCWNGQREIPSNKMDHMAYPSQVMTGECPKEFPERLPSLFYEIIWDTYAFKGLQGRFVIANGDPTGYGFHGDFIMGWDEELLSKAVNTCTNLSGVVSDCPLFTIQDPSVAASCSLASVPTVAANEGKIVENLDHLPGNLEVQAGPAYAHGEVPGQKNHHAKVTEPHLEPLHEQDNQKDQEPPVIKPPYPTAESVAEPIFPTAASVLVAEEEEIASPVEAAPPAPVTPAPKIQEDKEPDTRSYYSTEYKTVGKEVIKILWVEEAITVTVTQTVTMNLAGVKRSYFPPTHTP